MLQKLGTGEAQMITGGQVSLQQCQGVPFAMVCKDTNGTRSVELSIPTTNAPLNLSIPLTNETKKQVVDTGLKAVQAVASSKVGRAAAKIVGATGPHPFPLPRP